MTVNTAAPAADHSVVRNFVSAIGVRASHLYESTRASSPEVVKSSIAQVESLLTPYRDPVMTKLREHGEPLLTLIDNTIAETIVPQAKSVEGSVIDVVTKSETYLKSSVQKAQDNLNATEQYLGRVTEQVIGPYQQKLTEAAKRNKEKVEQTTRNAVDVIVAQADRAIDYVLPEASSESHPEPSADSTRLTRKVASRLYGKVSEVYHYSAERASQIVHVDLISYAKATLGANEENIAKAFDRVIAMLPSPERAQSTAERFTARLPAPVRTFVTRTARVTAPLVNLAFVHMTSFLLFLRSFAVATQPTTTTTTSDCPIPNPTTSPDDVPSQSHAEPTRSDPSAGTTTATTDSWIDVPTDSNTTSPQPTAETTTAATAPAPLVTAESVLSSPELVPATSDVTVPSAEVLSPRKRGGKHKKAAHAAVEGGVPTASAGQDQTIQ